MKILNIYSARSLPDACYTRLKIYIISPFLAQNTTFSKTFFLSSIFEWNNLDPHLRKFGDFSLFKSNVLKFIQPSPNSVYNCHKPRWICLITRLRLGLSHLREHKFKHGFQDMLNPLCSCGNDVESTEHFLLHCPQFVNERRTLLSTLGNFNCSLLENTSKVLTQTLLFGNTSLSPSDNSKILSATIYFMLSTERFDEQLFQKMKVVSTDHKQANNLTSLIICFFKHQIYFYFLFAYVETSIIFWFYLDNLFFWFY